MKLLHNNRRTPEHLHTKKLTILPRGPNKSREGHHRKVNTQNINIYNIVNNNVLGKVTQETNGFVAEKSYGTPSQLVKAKPKSKHEFELEQELKLYRSEIEFRYKRSRVNQAYVYPRRGRTNTEEGQCASWTETIPVSIYAPDIQRANSIKHKLRVPHRKPHSHDKAALYIKGNIRNYIQDMIKTNSHKDSVKKYEQSVMCNDSFGKHMQMGIISQKVVNAKVKPFFYSEVPERVKEDKGRPEIKTSEGLYNCTKKGHYRTNTFNPIETACNFSMLRQNVVTNTTGNSKDTAGNITDYFKAIITKNRNAESRSMNRTKVIVKDTESKHFNNTLSLNTFLHYANSSYKRK
eukprot:TRINITY_DN1171_c0_g4_i1.p1 TRINITY_DN1171_c0_g4~~TRINITY_DN1171_c0_g4_i1.p1  ORF type:complete len:349 (+),score=84.58 TRINITY_DN1171_c0_g4_i1:164-1210(+)